jgi:hypothetical protein
MSDPWIICRYSSLLTVFVSGTCISHLWSLDSLIFGLCWSLTPHISGSCIHISGISGQISTMLNSLEPVPLSQLGR